MSIGRNKVAPLSDAVNLQWANGKSLGRETIGTGRFGPWVGFHIEQGKDEELDAAMEAADILLGEIKHQRQGGAEIVRHWLLGEQARLFVVTSGPVAETMAGCVGRNAPATAEAGIGARWGTNERSKLAVRAYLEPLVKVGYLRPLQLSCRSRMTDVLLRCLLDHGRVCEAADGLVDRQRHPDVVTYHEIALPLVAGEEEEWGKGDTATVVPFRSAHPEQIDGAYLRTVWRPDSVHGAALRDWEGIQTWAQSYAQESEEQPAGDAGASRRAAPVYEDAL